MKTIERANRLAQEGEIDHGLDVLYTGLDRVKWNGSFEKLDEMLATIDVMNIHTAILIGILTNTINLPPGVILQARPDFFIRAKEVIVSRGENEKGLFEGLDN